MFDFKHSPSHQTLVEEITIIQIPASQGQMIPKFCYGLAFENYLFNVSVKSSVDGSNWNEDWSYSLTILLIFIKIEVNYSHIQKCT